MTDRLYSITEKAEEIGVTIETLRMWRIAGTGPVWVKYGDTVRYWPEVKPEMPDVPSVNSGGAQ